jgi:hypothetical protein
MDRPSNRHGVSEDDALDTTAGDPVLEIASILGQAYLQCVVSGVRFGYKATKRIIQGESQVLTRMRGSQSPQDFGEQALRTVVDEARGCLRDIVDAASEEFRRLESRLNRLQQGARSIIDHAEDSGVYTRRWRAKP